MKGEGHAAHKLGGARCCAEGHKYGTDVGGKQLYCILTLTPHVCTNG